MKQALIICSFFLLLGTNSVAQREFFKNTSVSFLFHQGSSLPEYSFVNYLTNDYLHAFTLDFTKRTTGKNDWERLYKYPEVGISLFYTSLGNKDVLGNALALNYFFRVHFISTEKWKVYNQTGIGLGYLTKRFDLVDNYKNVGIGSHYNAHFSFRLGTSYALTEKLDAKLGLSFDHFSNGNTADPNLGLNNISVFAGLTSAIGEQTPKNNSPLSEHIKKNQFEAILSFGGKQTRALSSEFFYTSSLSAGVSRSFFKGVHFGVGADVFYDRAVQTQMEARGETFHPIDQFQTGFHISQEFVYNRFRLIIQEGIYVGLVNKGIRKMMYNRGIVQFQLNKNLFLRMAMKSHLHILDFPEIGLGIKW